MWDSLRSCSLCLFNSADNDRKIQPWLTIDDAQFDNAVRALHSSSKISPIQSIQSPYLPSLISYLWPLVESGSNVWTVEYWTNKENLPSQFFLKYDLLIWNSFFRLPKSSSVSTGSNLYPKVLILAPHWSTCESINEHLNKMKSDPLKRFLVKCFYEGQHLAIDSIIEPSDILITTPTMIDELIQKRLIHFEQTHLVLYDQLDLLVQSVEPLERFVNHLHLQTEKSKKVQHLCFSHRFTQSSKDFLEKIFSKPDENYFFLSSSILESYSYRNFLVYGEPSRNWVERKHQMKEIFDLAARHQKKILFCANQLRLLTNVQSALNDLSIQSILLHSQLSSEQIDQHVNEWQTINDRPMILLIQDDVLSDLKIDRTDILVHLDFQRFSWYQVSNHRAKLFYRHLFEEKSFDFTDKSQLNSLKSIGQFYQENSSVSVPIMIFLWPGDSAQVTYEFIDYLKSSQSYVHPLIERLALNSCNETIQSKLDVEFCPTLKLFGRCFNRSKLKRCPYRHNFHLSVDAIEERPNDPSEINEFHLSKTFDLFLPRRGEIELRVTHVTDGNHLWAHVLRSRTDSNQPMRKIFDYQQFQQDLQNAFRQVQYQPLSEIVAGEIYLYNDRNHRVHRVYFNGQEKTYFDIRRSDAIRNRLLRVSKEISTDIQDQDEIQELPMITIENSPIENPVDRPALSIFSLDTGETFTMNNNEFLYPIEPATLKRFPPLAIEIVLCNIAPLDKINMKFTPLTIETVRSLTLNETLMGRIQLATRTCLWIDPLVKPVYLAAFKRIAYDKPIRTQLIQSKLVEANDNHLVDLQSLAVQAELEVEKEETIESSCQSVEEETSTFKPFLNRRGQLIMNPLGRSKCFFSSNEDKSEMNVVPTVQLSGHAAADREIPVGRGHQIHSELSKINVTPLPSASMLEEQKLCVDEKRENSMNISKSTEIEMNNRSKNFSTDETSKSLNKKDDDQDDQMMFIFGPKLFSQLRQIKEMEDEQRRQADFPVQRTRHRANRFNQNSTNGKSNHSDLADENNGNQSENISTINMNRGERSIDERESLNQEQIDYKQSPRKTRLFWEQTSRDVYLTIGFYNVDSTQTRIEFEKNFIECRVKIRFSERYVRIYLAEEIQPEKCSFQVRRSNILLTLRKMNEGKTWTVLTNQLIEPRPDLFTVDYGSDDESETEKRRRTIHRQWQKIREENKPTNSNDNQEKYLLDEMDDQDVQEEKNVDEQTETSSDCVSTDSDDCYYEDQVPANHIPKGYEEADYDHRFYGQKSKS